MNALNHPISTAADVNAMLQAESLPPTRRPDLLSGISRMCSMLGCQAAALKLHVPALREKIGDLRRAAHGISKKSFATLCSAFAAALELAGVIDSFGRGDAKRHPRLGATRRTDRARQADGERPCGLYELVRPGGHQA